MKDEKVTFKSASQAAQFGFSIGSKIIESIDGKVPNDVIQKLIADKDESSEFKQFVSEITERILNIKSDPWKREKEKVAKFTRETLGFRTEIDWTNTVIPVTEIADMQHFEFVPAAITEDELFAIYEKLFGKDNVYKAYKSISKAIKTQQSRPVGDYCVLHRGGQEPDAEHLNKSYDDFSGDGKKYMTPKEGIIAALRFRVETGNMYDVKGVTRFHALDADGDAMFMYRYGDGRFYISGSNRDYRFSGCGPREVSF